MECYFDNSASTRVLDSVKDIVVKTMTEVTAMQPPNTEKAWRRSSISGRPAELLQEP